MGSLSETVQNCFCLAPEEVKVGVSYVAQANTCHTHPSVMEPLLDQGHGCVLGTPENKYEKDTGLKYENPFIFHFTLHSLVTPAHPGPLQKQHVLSIARPN